MNNTFIGDPLYSKIKVYDYVCVEESTLDK